MESKICLSCKNELNFSNFYKAGWQNNKQRYKSQCKNCYKKLTYLKSFRIAVNKYHQNPEVKLKEKIRHNLRYKIKIGEVIKKNCCVCNSSNSQIHHIDYNYPEEIIWFCDKHHRRIHDTIPIFLRNRKAKKLTKEFERFIQEKKALP